MGGARKRTGAKERESKKGSWKAGKRGRVRDGEKRAKGNVNEGAREREVRCLDNKTPFDRFGAPSFPSP